VVDGVWNAPPVGIGLQETVGCGRSGVAVVDEHDAIADEHVIFNSNPFADEGVARDLAATPHKSILLNLHKRADFRFVADLAPVEGHKVVNLDILTQLDVGRNALQHSHRYTPFPWLGIECCAASSTLTTPSPDSPSLRGRCPVSMQSIKCSHSTCKASRVSSRGICTSPIR